MQSQAKQYMRYDAVILVYSNFNSPSANCPRLHQGLLGDYKCQFSSVNKQTDNFVTHEWTSDILTKSTMASLQHVKEQTTGVRIKYSETAST
jgi:hypothetical protein